MKLTLDRSEGCKLLIACTTIAQDFDMRNDERNAKIWRNLHDKIREQIVEFDKKNSNFYPNADENGMVDVSDYPYTK